MAIMGSASQEERDEDRDLRRLASDRMLRRVVVYIVSAFAAAVIAKFPEQVLTLLERLGEGWIPPIDLLKANRVDLFLAAVALVLLLHLITFWVLMSWKWRTFLPFLESKTANNVVLAFINMTSVFVKAQRMSQSRSVAGAALLSYAIFRITDVQEPSLTSTLASGGTFWPVLFVSAVGVLLLVAAFMLRFGFHYTKIVLPELLAALVAAEATTMKQDEVDTRVREIIRRVRVERPWWFFGPTSVF